MTLSRLAMALLLCASLMAALSSPDQLASAQDVSGPLITDLTTGIPIIGLNYTITVMATDASGLERVQFYIFFDPSNSTPIHNIILYAHDYSPGTTEFSTIVDIPLVARTLKYQVIARDVLGNIAVTNVTSRQVQDSIGPVAACPSAVTLNMGDVHTFDGSASTDNVGIVNYTWSFNYAGSTILLYGPTATHQFFVPGAYSGTLTVRDEWGNSNSKAFTVTVKDDQPPVAMAGPPLSVWVGNITFLYGTASMDNVGITNHTWQFTHNGTIVRLYGDSPTFSFWAVGTYSITLTVSDAEGNTNSTVQVVEVIKRPAEGGGGLPWWSFILAVMICLFVILTIVILRMK